MWKIIQQILPIFLFILVISQYVIPLVFNYQTWWLFRPSKKVNVDNKVKPETLSDEIENTKVVVNETNSKVDEVIKKVDGNLKTAKDLKKEADSLKNK